MMTMSGGLQSPKNKKLFIIGGAVIVLLLVVAGYLFWQLTIKNDPAAANKETIERVTKQVGQIFQVPADEEPQVAKVTDPAKIKDQPFFAGVAQDDYVIIYQKAKLALLYREKDRKLINVDHVELDQEATN